MGDTQHLQRYSNNCAWGPSTFVHLQQQLCMGALNICTFTAKQCMEGPQHLQRYSNNFASGALNICNVTETTVHGGPQHLHIYSNNSASGALIICTFIATTVHRKPLTFAHLNQQLCALGALNICIILSIQYSIILTLYTVRNR
jgi:hypothetical protein